MKYCLQLLTDLSALTLNCKPQFIITPKRINTVRLQQGIMALINKNITILFMSQHEFIQQLCNANIMIEGTVAHDKELMEVAIMTNKRNTIHRQCNSDIEQLAMSSHILGHAKKHLSQKYVFPLQGKSYAGHFLPAS